MRGFSCLLLALIQEVGKDASQVFFSARYSDPSPALPIKRHRSVAPSVLVFHPEFFNLNPTHILNTLFWWILPSFLPIIVCESQKEMPLPTGRQQGARAIMGQNPRLPSSQPRVVPCWIVGGPAQFSIGER